MSVFADAIRRSDPRTRRLYFDISGVGLPEWQKHASAVAACIRQVGPIACCLARTALPTSCDRLKRGRRVDNFPSPFRRRRRLRRTSPHTFAHRTIANLLRPNQAVPPLEPVSSLKVTRNAFAVTLKANLLGSSWRCVGVGSGSPLLVRTKATYQMWYCHLGGSRHPPQPVNPLQPHVELVLTRENPARLPPSPTVHVRV